MEIKTKYEIGQRVGTIFNNKPLTGIVQMIEVKVTRQNKIKINYVLSGRNGSQSPATHGRDEDELYPVPDEQGDNVKEGAAA